MECTPSNTNLLMENKIQSVIILFCSTIIQYKTPEINKIAPHKIT